MERTLILSAISCVLLSFIIFTSYPEVSSAHISKTFGNTTIEVGWSTEPPLVSDLNSIIIQVYKGPSENQTPVLNALADLSLSVKYGTVSKQIDFQPSPTTDGGYEAKIIPTRLGPYYLMVQGEVKGEKVDGEFKIEDVESKGIYSFPDNSIDITNANNNNQQLQDAISKLSDDIQISKEDLNASQKQMNEIQESITSLQSDSDSSYLILIIALGVSIAGIIMAVYLFTILRFKKGITGAT